MERFLDRVIRLGKARGIDGLQPISLAAGLSKSYLSRHKNALKENPDAQPSAESVRALAKFFGCSTDYLLTGKHPEQLPHDPDDPFPHRSEAVLIARAFHYDEAAIQHVLSLPGDPALTTLDWYRRIEGCVLERSRASEQT